MASADGGHNFAAISDDLTGRFTRLRASSPSVAYAWGRAGALARTTDGGEKWSSLTPPSGADLVDVSFPSTNDGYALDVQGSLMRTDDGGQRWRLLDIGTYLKPRAVLALDSTDVLLVGSRGLRRSDNGGFRFGRVRQELVAKLALVDGGTASGLVYAYGPRALVVSADRGVTWRAATLPKWGKNLVRVDFVTDSTAYALTRNGRVWKTVDQARHWHEISAIGTGLGTDLAFSDPANGYVAISQFGNDQHGYVMRTSDGGSTWRPQLLERARVRRGALAAPGPLAGFAISDVDHLLATSTGGDVGERSSVELSVRRRRPGKPGVIALSGRLTSARGGETVVVSKREIDEHWLLAEVTVSSSGHFTVFTQVTRPTQFVAQWSGDDTRAGAGSPLLTVNVAQTPPNPKAKPKR